MAGNAPNIIYELKCEHAVVGPSSIINGQLWCPWHQATVEITGVHPWEWRAKCVNCRFARWAGLVKNHAELFANSHIRKNPGHGCFTDYTINPEAEKTQAKMEAWNGRVQRT